MRLAAYAGASVALATGVFLKALHQRANFYAACVYLSQSSANLMILTNVSLLAVGFLLFWLQRLLYGPLRPIETEQLYEKAWFAVTETCLAMTIFRGELGGWFLVMFVCLLAGKVWGWIGEGRVEFVEQQPPPNPRWFHARLATSLLLSVAFNSLMLKYCVQTVLEQARPDMMVMFGFEFAVLTILSTSTAARYAITLVEIYINNQQKKARIEERRREIREARAETVRQQALRGEPSPTLPPDEEVNEMELDIPGWEEKGRWIFYLDLATDFLKLTVYLTFFAILFTFYGLPIHILRDVVVTIRSFARRIMDFLRYRNATRDMNERYPDATAEEVAREEVCIICREEMTPWQPPAGGGARPRIPERLRPKKLPCGHILHFVCLRSWLERQQNCPTCRRPVIPPPRPHGAQEGGGGLGPQPRPADGLPRARVFQFGPFRIGFGAGRGDPFHNMHQQIRQGNAPPGARQIGFGFGFGRPPAPAPTPAPAQAHAPTQAPLPSAASTADMQNHLQQMEQQIVQEINNLRVTVDQLHLVRLLQSELQRLRNLPATPSNPPGIPIPTASAASSAASPVALHRQFASDPRAPAMTANDARLPEGLSLPPGWSLLPLHATDAQEPGSTGVRGTDPATPTVPTTGVPAPAPDEGPSPPVHAPPLHEAEERIPDPTLTTAASPPSTVPQWNFGNPTGPVGPSTAPASPPPAESSAAADGQATGEDEDSESSYKGKTRVATVEDAGDEET
ncbi:hypothetical protein BDW42DRAFT_184534 [Aspergillus taichungensis]|uniref:RING-type E3 ubiquitin transferase n=1 Tax=Aspergillus taichungensis TaxID=482145 RepID=A0A2J5HZF9_9EURO|nr:hypothetical protein BDW42DRAFT_184534 [Aspergillus taichungensis]